MAPLRLRRPSAALIVSTIALIASLGGTSYAAFALPKNSVGTKQLRNNAVTTGKINTGAVTGSKINLGSLGTVPNATHANNATNATNAGHASTADNATNAGHASIADSATNAGHASTADSASSATSLNGVQLKKFSSSFPLGTGTTTLIDLGGVSITGACDAGGVATISASKDAGQPTMAFNFTSASTGASSNTVDGTSDFSSFVLTSSTPNTTGEFVATSSAATTSANYMARGGNADCLFAGTVISG